MPALTPRPWHPSQGALTCCTWCRSLPGETALTPLLSLRTRPSWAQAQQRGTNRGQTLGLAPTLAWPRLQTWGRIHKRNYKPSSHRSPQQSSCLGATPHTQARVGVSRRVQWWRPAGTLTLIYDFPGMRGSRSGGGAHALGVGLAASLQGSVSTFWKLLQHFYRSQE